MNTIRDEEFGGLIMIPLLVDWHVRRCNVKDCADKPTTIITGAHPDAPVIGLCEKHYQHSKTTGELDYTLVFDGDA